MEPLTPRRLVLALSMISAATIVEIYALSQGVDGTGLFAFLALMTAIAGFKLGSLLH